METGLGHYMRLEEGKEVTRLKPGQIIQIRLASLVGDLAKEFDRSGNVPSDGKHCQP